MPSKFRLSGIFEPSKSTTTSKQDISPNFHATVYQVSEVVRPTTRASVLVKSPPGSLKHQFQNGDHYQDDRLLRTPSSSTTKTSHKSQQYPPLPQPQSPKKDKRRRQKHSLAKQMNSVKNVLAEYCFALDNKQYDKLGKLFAPNCLAFYNAVAPPSSFHFLPTTNSASNDNAATASSGLRGREAVVAFLRGRVHDKTTIHCLTTQHLEFEFGRDNNNEDDDNDDNKAGSDGDFGPATACIAKTYFTANTFSLPSRQRPHAPYVHTVQHGQYVDVLRPTATDRYDPSGTGLGAWEIHHRRLIVMVPRLVQPGALANGSHEEVEQRYELQQQQYFHHRQQEQEAHRRRSLQHQQMQQLQRRHSHHPQQEHHAQQRVHPPLPDQAAAPPPSPIIQQEPISRQPTPVQQAQISRQPTPLQQREEPRQRLASPPPQKEAHPPRYYAQQSNTLPPQLQPQTTSRQHQDEIAQRRRSYHHHQPLETQQPDKCQLQPEELVRRRRSYHPGVSDGSQFTSRQQQHDQSASRRRSYHPHTAKQEEREPVSPVSPVSPIED